MAEVPAPTFPWLLRPAWNASDPSSQCERYNDALDRTSIHQRLTTVRGDYWLCAETGQLTRDDATDAGAEVYDENYEQDIEAQLNLQSRITSHGRWLKGMTPYRKTGRLLEVGCGLGMFLKAAVDAGWQAEGNEFSPVAAEHARQLSGAEVRVGPAEQLELEAGVYDLVLCDNVFEHLLEPRKVLNALARSLRPGGVIFFQTLLGQSLSVYFQPRGWYYFTKGHLYVPTFVSMEHYYAAAGLEPLNIETHGFRSSAPTDGALAARRNRKFVDKCVASVAARLGWGHRIRGLLRRPEHATD